MSLSRVYEVLKSNEKLKDKLEINESSDLINIDFNEYLHLFVTDDVIVLNNDLTHWHPSDEEDIIELIIEIANGDYVFIESKCWFSFRKLRILTKENFEKKKEKSLAKRHLCIYTGDAIIKRNDPVRHRN